ncbi:MAG: hypothetical protein J5764_01775 [Bacteroidales bacterium]|nr:hypothetical protein [Bacteroidales bacterium]
MEYLSKQRYDEIAAELKHLIDEVYPKVRDDLAEASAQGDRSDNAGYREARRNQSKTISRIRFLQKILEHSRVVDHDLLPEDRVSLLSLANSRIFRPMPGCNSRSSAPRDES